MNIALAGVEAGARARVMAAAMADLRTAKIFDPNDMPFDGKRMSYDGFDVMISL